MIKFERHTEHLHDERISTMISDYTHKLETQLRSKPKRWNVKWKLKPHPSNRDQGIVQTKQHWGEIREAQLIQTGKIADTAACFYFFLSADISYVQSYIYTTSIIIHYKIANKINLKLST